MALTTAQKIALFSILEVPYDGKVFLPQGDFNLTALTYTSSNQESKLQLLIESHLATMPSDVESVLISYINDWLMVGTNVASIDAGAIGGTSGISYDPTLRLQRIQSQVKILVPVMRFIREIQVGEEGNKSGMNMETFR